MAQMMRQVGRRKIFFTDHALDRFWQRFLDKEPHAGRKEAREALDTLMEAARWNRTPPPWARMNLWHRARCEGVVHLDDDHVFIVHRNPNRDLVAVTYIINHKEYSNAD